MANWTIIDETAVRTGKLAVFIDAMQARAAAATQPDPLPEMISDVVATIRAALSTGNTLDQDTTKIPNSLKGLALRLINRRVKGYLDRELTSEETAQANDDRGYLNRIMDQKIRFETPDDPAGSAEMQGGSSIQVGDQIDSPTQLSRATSRRKLDSLL